MATDGTTFSSALQELYSTIWWWRRYSVFCVDAPARRTQVHACFFCVAGVATKRRDRNRIGVGSRRLLRQTRL